MEAAGNNYEAKLKVLNLALEKAKTDRARAEATKEGLEKQLDGIISDIRALGVEPENLGITISDLDSGIQSDLARLEELIPAEYLEQGA